MEKQYKNCHVFEEHTNFYEFAGGSVIKKDCETWICYLAASYQVMPANTHCIMQHL